MKPLDHIPPLPSNDKDLTKRLMRRLTHLCAFLTIKNHRTPACELTLVNGDDVTLVQTTAGFDLTINNRGASTVFVTVLNLTPLYGVSQIFPPTGGGQGVIVETGRSCKVQIETQIPLELTERPWNGPYTMTDILKVLISSRQVDFTFFRLNNIIEAERGRFRDLRSITPRVAPWQVEEREISTSVTTSPTFALYPDI